MTTQPKENNLSKYDGKEPHSSKSSKPRPNIDHLIKRIISERKEEKKRGLLTLLVVIILAGGTTLFYL